MKLASITFALASLLSSTALAQQGPWQPEQPPPPAPAEDVDTDDTGAQEERAPIQEEERSPSATAIVYAGQAPSNAPARSVSEVSPRAEAPAIDQRVMHGFRVGYGVIFNHDRDPDGEEGEMESLKDEFGLRSPHNFLLGYDVMYRMIGHDWLNVILIGNVTIAGLEQSKFIPQASGLIGAEFNESFQLGVGVNFTPEPDRPAHMILAAGWTPRAGGFHVPFHVFFIPDVDKFHRAGITTGVSW